MRSETVAVQFTSDCRILFLRATSDGGRLVDGELPELLELLQGIVDLGIRFLVGDVLDIVKIVLSIAATVWFGRRYVKRHIRRLLEKQVQEIAKDEQLDRSTVKNHTQTAIEKARGLEVAISMFDPADAFQTASKYCAQRQPEYGIELLSRETLLAQAAAELSEKRAHNARMKAATAQFKIGLIRRSQGDSVEALRAFKAMLSLHPDDIDGLRFGGQELESQGRLSEARENFELIEKIAIGIGDNILRGEALRSLARVNDSFRDALVQLEECLVIEKSIHHDVGIAHTWKELADLRCKPGHWNLAEEAYESALRIYFAIGHHEAVQEVEAAKSSMTMARKAASNRELVPTDA